jgi:hypothetical protein
MHNLYSSGQPGQLCFEQGQNFAFDMGMIGLIFTRRQKVTVKCIVLTMFFYLFMP